MVSAHNSDKTSPFFVIVVPVIHSLKDLGLCLASLDGLDYPKKDFHVVLIDCLVVKGTKQFLSENLRKYKFISTTISLPDITLNGVQKWLIDARLNEARNYAIRAIQGENYVFTEDDCSFETDWLLKIEKALTGEVGAIGGPDFIPEGMSWFSQVMDCMINSFLGNVGTRRGHGDGENTYYPPKENMTIPAKTIAMIGEFAEERIIGSEMEMAKRIKDAGLEIKFTPDNHVWHRRVNSVKNFFRFSSLMASEKVQLMRKQQTFIPSLHFLMLLAGIAGITIGVLSLVNTYAGIIFSVFFGCYLLVLSGIAIQSVFRTRSLTVGVGVFVLMQIYHVSLFFGILEGTFIRRKDR